ncbi:hypothetical protein C3486_01180 [Streptomyces sp. Ru73]|uniref:hypothetical protein n=1 Tax=Streptomyces sp. Ru73 TaxID=2080748 RepID=UPI000CDE238E|nr:hypothetical protein [Streptomyces sp. Ru73]POX43196.1 hypothetical protein C3486_01180 [Streptomyces sp. Ru73]
MSASFRLELVRPGLYEGTVRLDLSAARLPFLGPDGVRHARLCVGHRGQRCGGWLLAPLGSPPLGMRVRNRRTGTHRVTLATEPRGAGRLQVSWERRGLVAPAAALLAPVRRLARPRAQHLRGLWRGLTT